MPDDDLGPMPGMGGDSIFDQLFALLRSSGPVNWKLAREVTKSLVGAPEPIEPALAEEYQELGTAALLRLESSAELPPPASGTIHPTDRVTWAMENQQAFRVLVEPLADKFGSGLGGAVPGGFGGMLDQLGPAIVGMQAGTMVGFMAHRVLGQFDTGIPSLEHERAYLVVPNVEEFALVNDLDVRQVRMWAALHEMSFQRLMGIEWLRGHFVSIVTSYYETVELDVAGMVSRLASLQDPSEIESVLSEGTGGMPSLVAGTIDQTRLGRVQAFVAILAGYADHLVDRAATELLPDLDRIDTAYRLRRAEPDQASEFLVQLAGLDLRRSLADDAVSFCREVERRWGEEALQGLWQDPEHLPTVEELTDPVGWAARTLLD